MRTRRAVTTDAASLLLHPVRMRIVVAFAGGGPMTAQALSSRLPDVPSATLYRHLGVLAEAGVLTVVGERRVRGAVERSYELASDRAFVAPNDVAGASVDDRLRAFTTFLATLLSDYAAHLARGAEATTEPAAFFVTPIRLSDADF